MKYQDILYKVEDGIATITLNRPQALNANTVHSFREITDAIEEHARKDEEVRVLVLTGAGRAFCAGDDVKGLFLNPDGLTQWQAWRIERLRQARTIVAAHYEALLSLDKPIIASVNGPAVGGGMDLTLSCDIRIASERAQFGQFFVRRGLLGSVGATYLLPRIVGLSKAYELALTGDLIDAQEALRIGLVSKVVPHEQLESATRELALKLAKGAPLAQRAIKQAMKRALSLDWQTALQCGLGYGDTLNATEDHKEGSRAFVEKREPVYKGR